MAAAGDRLITEDDVTDSEDGMKERWTGTLSFDDVITLLLGHSWFQSNSETGYKRFFHDDCRRQA